MSVLDWESEAYRHNGDHDLMTELDLRTWSFGRDMTDLGTVTVSKGDEGVATVKVEVAALPAQFWRFTCTTEEGVETIVETGSGGFTEYWPIAYKIATNMLVIVKEAT